MTPLSMTTESFGLTLTIWLVLSNVIAHPLK